MGVSITAFDGGRTSAATARADAQAEAAEPAARRPRSSACGFEVTSRVLELETGPRPRSRSPRATSRPPARTCGSARTATRPASARPRTCSTPRPGSCARPRPDPGRDPSCRSRAPRLDRARRTMSRAAAIEVSPAGQALRRLRRRRRPELRRWRRERSSASWAATARASRTAIRMHVRPAQPDLGHLPDPGHRRGQGPRGGEAPHRLHDPALQPLRRPDGRPEPRASSEASTACTARSSRRAGTGPVGWPAWKARSTCSPGPCPEAGSSAWPWPAPCCTSRRSCSSTSRRAESTPSRGAASGRLIDTLAASGVTIIVTTHYLDEAERCDRIALMHAGRLVSLGTVAELKEVFAGRALLEVTCPRFLEAQAHLEAEPFVHEAALFGTRLHIVVDDAETGRARTLDGPRARGQHPGRGRAHRAFAGGRLHPLHREGRRGPRRRRPAVPREPAQDPGHRGARSWFRPRAIPCRSSCCWACPR